MGHRDLWSEPVDVLTLTPYLPWKHWESFCLVIGRSESGIAAHPLTASTSCIYLSIECFRSHVRTT